MSDLIKRSDAIRAVADYFDYSRRFVESILSEVPSTDRPQGEWITIRQCSHGKIERCSRCGKKYRALCKWNFCPNCGAFMRKGADDE